MKTLRISTAGSVDDGKSTLIGRLLYETNSIAKDKLEALHRASKSKGLDFLDLSLLTDGLIAEREQGITIDVAYIYFATATRKYIIGDTPGHVEYTRNMITGASNASVSIILIDARKGISEQTKRHFYVASLLRLPNVIVCVNKMDLVDYSQEIFEAIKFDFQELKDKISFDGTLTFIPISSLYGENITRKSEKMTWFGGNSLLEVLEKLPTDGAKIKKMPLRFPIQYVIRPKVSEFHDFRGFAGRVASGSFSVGDEVIALPNQKKSKVKSIEKFGIQLMSAEKGDSLVVTLEDEIDVSRGSMIVKMGEIPKERKEIEATVCWMDSQPLVSGKTYLLQQGINRVKAKISSLANQINIETFEVINPLESLKMNEIATIKLKTSAPVFADSFSENSNNGSFILIDEQTNSTVGVGFVG